jgi:hypothetical protein
LSQDGRISNWIVSTKPRKEGEDHQTQEKKRKRKEMKRKPQANKKLMLMFVC